MKNEFKTIYELFFINKSVIIFSCDSMLRIRFQTALSRSSCTFFSQRLSSTPRIFFMIFGSIVEYFSNFFGKWRLGMIFSRELLLFSCWSSCWSRPSSILMLTSRDDSGALRVRISLDLFGWITIFPSGIVCGNMLMIDFNQRQLPDRARIMLSYLLRTLMRWHRSTNSPSCLMTYNRKDHERVFNGFYLNLHACHQLPGHSAD